MQNDIGDLGENIFSVVISRDYTFRPRHLGEKWPISDFYVELVGPAEKFYFIVQIKATNRGINRNNKLRISAPVENLNRLCQYYCPTYLAGVDVQTERVYLIPVNSTLESGIYGLPTTFELTTANRIRLFDDVKAFWEGTDLFNYKSQFNHTI